jgi:VWFA-related protein
VRGPAALLVLGLGCLTTVQARQATAPQTTFKAGVDLVQVDVSVLDRNRRPVRGLTAADFTVLEDGKPTAIVAFAPVELPERPVPSPADAAWRRNVAPDVIANDLPRDGRLVVILFDHTIMLVQQPLARRIATAAVDALGPADLAAIVHTVDGTPQGLTKDRTRLLAAINATYMGLADGDPALADAAGAGTQAARSQSRASSPWDRGQCPGGLCTLETVTRIADALRDAPRRKMLVFIGTSLRLQSTEPESAELKQGRERMFRALEVANLTVYSMDPTGLETLAADASRPSGARPSADRTPLMETNLIRQGNLAVIAERTGGRAIVNANSPDSLVPAILAESGSYYTLGFRPGNRAADGRFHQVAVRVDRRNVSVHARKGYYADRGSRPVVSVDAAAAPRALLDALSGNWPVSDLPVHAAVSPFADPAGARPVAVLVIATRRSAEGRGNRPVNVLAEAFDTNGRSVNYHHQALDIGAALSASGSSDYEILSRLPLEPGRYEIRVGVHDAADDRVGTVHTYLDVPNFARAPLSASGIVLDAAPGPLSAPDGMFGSLFDARPTARRTFSRADTVTALLRLYQGGRDTPAAVKIRSQIQDTSGTPVLDDTTTAAAERFNDPGRSADFRLNLPVERLDPGEYLLTVEISLGSRVERRDVRFSVR